MVSTVNSYDLTERRSDATSPIEPIKALIQSLDARIVQYAAEKNWQNNERLEQLIHDHQQRILDLKTFRARLKENELGFPQDEIEILDQQVKILTNQLREMHFYLMQLQVDPENAVRLIALRDKVFGSPTSHEAKNAAIREIIAKLSSPALSDWLIQQFAKPDWYGWCYEPEQIEKTINLTNSLLRAYSNTITYPQLQSHLLKYNATFLPFTRECLTLLKSKLDVTHLASDFNKMHDYLRELTHQVMSITDNFILMRKQIEPLVIRRFSDLQAIFDDYQLNVRPRELNVKKINEYVIALQEMQTTLNNYGKQLFALDDSVAIRTQLSNLQYDEDTIDELLQQKDALLETYKKHASAITELLKESGELRKDLSKDLNVRLPGETNIPEMQLFSESNAFFDRQKIEEANPGAPPTANPGLTRMDALLRASRRFSDHLRSH